MSNSKTPKSILKRPHSEISQDHTHIIWDEANLQQNELEKVPRMKIDEPKTPFHHSSLSPASRSPAQSPATRTIQDMGNEVESLELAGHIDTTSMRDHDDSSSIDDEDESDEEDDRFVGLTADEVDALKAKEAKFAALRKQHYNMRAALLKSRKFDDSDDESEEEDI